MGFYQYEFCEKWDFENVNSVKNEVLKIWFLPQCGLFERNARVLEDKENINYRDPFVVSVIKV